MSAQESAKAPANPADVATIDSIMKAVYDVISGDAGKARDWDRFRSLFIDGARLIPTTGKNKDTGLVAARVLTPEDYIKRSDPFLLKEGFHEREIARRVEISIKTVESHRAAAMRKAEVRTAAEFVRFAIKHNLIQA